MEQSAKPYLKVVGLHVEGLKALQRVDWPADGMAWNGKVPDMVMVGGVNGSGKTTLLEFIAGMVLLLAGDERRSKLWNWDLWRVAGRNAWLDLEVQSTATGLLKSRVIVGDDPFIADHRVGNLQAYARLANGFAPRTAIAEWMNLQAVLRSPSTFAESDLPSVVYFPTDRQLVIPDEPYKAAGRLNSDASFFYRFQPATKWTESIEALLFAARWADLNAKEAGHPEQATHFESYARAFQGFFGDDKRLAWTADGELVVKLTRDGSEHPMIELSSGEKQALLFAAELYRRWKPGSLILIDEPELHFHTSWQTTLWALLEKWQRERGGQVIVATQSNHLFSIAEPGTTVLLGRPLP
jgi:energy-coupling factor transporter ATP-binding protein EcfA2